MSVETVKLQILYDEGANDSYRMCIGIVLWYCIYDQTSQTFWRVWPYVGTFSLIGKWPSVWQMVAFNAQT